MLAPAAELGVAASGRAPPKTAAMTHRDDASVRIGGMVPSIGGLPPDRAHPPFFHQWWNLSIAHFRSEMGRRIVRSSSFKGRWQPILPGLPPLDTFGGNVYLSVTPDPTRSGPSPGKTESEPAAAACVTVRFETTAVADAGTPHSAAS